MALARYFAKDLLAINQILKGTNSTFENALNSHNIVVAFDENAISSVEGNNALELVIRLIARLYPTISLLDLTNKSKNKVNELAALARSINSQLTLGQPEKGTVCVAVGLVADLPIDCKTFYLGSDSWKAKVSELAPQKAGSSSNPFGCGIASCMAVSLVFKYIFAEFFPPSSDQKTTAFSVLDYAYDKFSELELREVNLNDIVLVGAGAIGNGCLWALSKVLGIQGTLTVVDGERLALSNLQRYILFEESHVDEPKAELGAKFFSHTELKIKAYYTDWKGYLEIRKDWAIHVVAVAIDNVGDRILVQSALPRTIFNSYTESNLLGVSRHENFVSSPCLACGYIPSDRTKDFIKQVADDCNIPGFSNLVKDYINLNQPVGAVFAPNTVSLLDLVSQANQISKDNLSAFKEKHVHEFYSEFICGGISLQLRQENKSAPIRVDAPLAFQSAMAGILLASEIVLNAMAVDRSSIRQTLHFYPLNHWGKGNPLQFDIEKDHTGRCLCKDSAFIDAYIDKWNNDI